MPIFEPGLENLINLNKSNGTLSFSSNPESLINSDLTWVTFDTPVDDQDIADVDFVINHIIALFPYYLSQQDKISTD